MGWLDYTVAYLEGGGGVVPGNQETPLGAPLLRRCLSASACIM